MQTTARRLFKSSRSGDMSTNPRLLNSTTKFDLYNKTYTYKIPIVNRRQSPRRRDQRIARAIDPRVTRSTSTHPPPLPRPPRAALTTSQQHILRGQNAPETMRLVRHELRRHADTHLVPKTKEGREHHAATLQSILDAQSDVLDTLNAMTKVHVDRSKECMEIIYDLYTDALLFSHRGKILAPSSHPQFHCYYMVFKDLEEIIHRQYSKSQREHTKIRSLCCPYCDVPLDYFKSPPPSYDPPHNPPSPPSSSSKSRSSPEYSPTKAFSSSSSSSSDTEDEQVPEPPPKIASSTHVALLDEKDIDDLNLQHLDVRKIIRKHRRPDSTELQFA